MTVLLVILAVLGAVLVLLAAAMLLPLSVRLRYAETLEVFAGVSFVKFKVFPKDKKEEPEKEKKKKNLAVKSSPRKISEADKPKPVLADKHDNKENKKSISDILKLVFEIIKSVFDVMGRRAKIRVDELKVVISKPDAADTAVQFGLCGGIVSNILAFTSNFAKADIKDENISLVPDFVTGKSSVRMDVTLSVTAGSLIVSIVKGYLKGTMKK